MSHRTFRAMWRPSVAMLFAVWSLAAPGVEFEPDMLGARVDLLSIDVAFARGQNSGRRAGLYRFSAGLALAAAPEDHFVIPGGAPPGVALREHRLELERSVGNGLRFVSASGRPHLAPLLSFGSAEQNVHLKLRRHALFLQYRRDFY